MSRAVDLPVQTPPYKVPESVLVVIRTPDLHILLLDRADVPGFWQSVTGSKDGPDEPWHAAAVREVAEETGIDALAPGCELLDWRIENVYDIYPRWRWRWRYAPGVTRNRERVFGLRVPDAAPVRLSPREHGDSAWLPWREAADRCASPSNAEACLLLPRFARGVCA
jgi:dATP pyrophosphohydrolase